MDDLINSTKVYSVLDINTAILNLLKNQFTNYIWVCGEIQGLRNARDKAHSYFELVEKHEEKDEVIAKAKAIIFANRKGLIEKRLQQAQGAFELKNDIEVKFLCEVSFYPPSGQYSLIVIDLDPNYTLGKVAQNRLAIIKDLEKLGLLEKNKQLSLSVVPLNIGLITAFDSAAYHDFLHELQSSKYGFKIYASNCYMQGKNVERDVLAGLKQFNFLSLEKLDAIVITRGGGSTADLAWFDNKKIAQAIATSKFPVISALGHSIDFTITDIVSHTSVKTPTKAGQFLVERIKAFIDEVNFTGESIFNKGKEVFKDKKRDLTMLAERMESFLSRYFRSHREVLIEDKHEMVNSLKLMLNKRKELINNSYKELNIGLNDLLLSNNKLITHFREKVEILNPKNILKRGYSITYAKGKVLRSVKDVEKEEPLKSVLYDGEVSSIVK